MEEVKLQMTTCIEQGEAKVDRAFRIHMGEVKCPNCHALLYDEDDYKVCEGNMFCNYCGEEVLRR